MINWKPIDNDARRGQTVLLCNFHEPVMRDENGVPNIISSKFNTEHYSFTKVGYFQEWSYIFPNIEPTHYAEIDNPLGDQT